MSAIRRTVLCPCTFWQPDQVDQQVVAENDPQPVEVGLRFRPDRDGFVTGLFFYHYPSNTGPFLGHLWSADGQLLAEASLDTTTDYVPRITFDQPVAVRAGQTYVVSYFTRSGNYAQTVLVLKQARFEAETAVGRWGRVDDL